MFSSPHTSPVMGWPWMSGPETELVGKLGFCLSRTFFFFWNLMLSLLGDIIARSLLHKDLSQQTLCPPLPKRNLPWPGGNSRWTLLSALGQLRLSPHSALAQTITPFKKLRSGSETDLLNLYAAVQIQHHCQVKSLAPLTALAAGCRG